MPMLKIPVRYFSFGNADLLKARLSGSGRIFVTSFPMPSVGDEFVNVVKVDCKNNSLSTEINSFGIV